MLFELNTHHFTMETVRRDFCNINRDAPKVTQVGSCYVHDFNGDINCSVIENYPYLNLLCMA